jgi:hypothetical protein
LEAIRFDTGDMWPPQVTPATSDSAVNDFQHETVINVIYAIQPATQKRKKLIVYPFANTILIT